MIETSPKLKRRRWQWAAGVFAAGLLTIWSFHLASRPVIDPRFLGMWKESGTSPGRTYVFAADGSYASFSNGKPTSPGRRQWGVVGNRFLAWNPGQTAGETLFGLWLTMQVRISRLIGSPMLTSRTEIADVQDSKIRFRIVMSDGRVQEETWERIQR